MFQTQLKSVAASVLAVMALSLNTVAAVPINQAALAAEAAAVMTHGEVRKVDAGAGTVTLRHEFIENLNMAGMTMVFHAKDRALLAGIKPGDKILFHAELGDGELEVARIQPAR